MKNEKAENQKMEDVSVSYTHLMDRYCRGDGGDEL